MSLKVDPLGLASLLCLSLFVPIVQLVNNWTKELEKSFVRFEPSIEAHQTIVVLDTVHTKLTASCGQALLQLVILCLQSFNYNWGPALIISLLPDTGGLSVVVSGVVFVVVTISVR